MAEQNLNFLSDNKLQQERNRVRVWKNVKKKFVKAPRFMKIC